MRPPQSLDTAAQTVTLADGTVLGYDELVIATGLVPKRIPSFPDLDGIQVLRSSTRRWRCASTPASRAARSIVGAGFIGCEVAASLRKLGVDVVLVEPQPTPLASVLGEQIGEPGDPAAPRRGRRRAHRARGGRGARRPTGTSSAVVLSDGTELDADLVVVGIGSRPATDWLEGSGIEVDNGVVCDEAGRTSAPHVWALGDVASWRDADGSSSARRALEQRRRAGPGAGAGDARPGAADAGRRCPTSGATSTTSRSSASASRRPTDVVHLVEDDGRKFLAYYERDGVLVGVVGGGMPGKVMKARAKIAAGAPIADVLG